MASHCAVSYIEPTLWKGCQLFNQWLKERKMASGKAVTTVFCARRAVLVAAMAICVFLPSFTFPSPALAQGFFGLFGNNDDEAFQVADPLDYTVSLTQSGLSDDEESELRAASSLITDVGRPVSGSLGLITKARNDRDQLIGALYQQAYYGGIVRVTIDGRDVDNIDPLFQFDAASPPVVTIDIRAGRKFTFGDVTLAGDTGGFSPESIGLVTGLTASSETVFDAERQIVSLLREQGHPFAEITDRRIEADHQSGTLDVYIEAAAGTTASLGEPEISGNRDVETGFIRRQSGIETGRLYSPDELSSARRNLLDLDVFETVTVRPGDALDPSGLLPVEIEVRERKLRYFGVGATFSNSDGAGVEGYWGHRNLFGQAEKLRVEASINRIGETADLGELNYSSAILFEKPGVLDPKSKFTANVRAVSENYDAFTRQSVRGGVGIEYKPDEKQTISAGLDLDWSVIDEPGTPEKTHLIFSTPLTWKYDASDDRLDPTSGYRLSMLAEPSHDFANSVSFIKGRAEVSTYFSPTGPDSPVTFAARVAAGSIAGAALGDVPADRRFYAGGGGSIRGYGFQSVGPKDGDGNPTGGLSLLETSLEARIAATETLGVVVFVDAGNVYTSEFPGGGGLKIGAGAGVRYKTPFGPLRLDVGIPLNPDRDDDDFGIYAGIGQAF